MTSFSVDEGRKCMCLLSFRDHVVGELPHFTIISGCGCGVSVLGIAHHFFFFFYHLGIPPYCYMTYGLWSSMYVCRCISTSRLHYVVQQHVLPIYLPTLIMVPIVGTAPR
ncbi:uncharacterized protein GGS25DRAFT_481445 [Hypoxylon fragiforme]|uniref:uncharacterized protein n=1 Tax=Hypoxylon fragiforme TaxID=63214 RepID=UPI0020C5B746|nr:uncharacterized protein GGS25DRAFT_481445 [Hypoxylon fragiforme]KAI2611114.1 hypothetical protein GGS25DRAFT_481445 [Hypoxylon fragiforme]